ncbi:MAG: type II toxin-antitoxin system VapC family toxin [bacterium]
MDKRLLDTDTLSYYFKGIETVVKKANKYHDEFGFFSISTLTVFEVLSGYKKINRPEKEQLFIEFCEENEVISFGYTAAQKAADIYEKLRSTGQLIGIADILIASIALTNNLILVTNNTAHFGRITGLSLENWAKK